VWRSSWPESSRSGFGSPDVPFAFPGWGLCLLVRFRVRFGFSFWGFFFSQAGSGSESESEEEVGDKGSR